MLMRLYCLSGRAAIVFLIFAIVLSSCKNSLEDWQAKSIELAKAGNDLTKDEYEQLVSIIETTPDDFGHLLNGDKTLNHAKIHDNLEKLFSSRKLNIPPDKIYSQSSPEAILPTTKFNVNVFLENSASMDGYVKGRTDFETAIYSLLGDIKLNSFCDSLKLNYINSSVHNFKPDIVDFIDKLEPSTFQARGGSRSTSDLSEVIKTVSSKVDNSNASILISDFVFSPGKINKLDARDYLNNQMLGIKMTFAELLKKQRLSVVVLHLESYFDGQYFDLEDTPHQYTGKRPYYIWVIGTEEQVQQILATKILDNIKGGILHKMVFNKFDSPKAIDFKIAQSPKIGSFELPHGGKGPIESAKYDENRNKGIFAFTLYAKFEDDVQDSSFYLDKSNYNCSSNYKIEVSKIEDEGNPATNGYQYMIKLETKDLKSEKFTLDIIAKTPQWISTISSSDDRNIDANNSEGSKTFGFSDLIDGLSAAFYPNNQVVLINHLDFNISKAGGSSSTAIVVFIIIAVITIVAVFLKRNK